jgi:hypothetical protein
MAQANPYEAPKAPVDAGPQASEDIDRIASGQKLIIYAVLLNILGLLLQAALPLLGVLVSLAALVLSFVGVVRLGGGLGYSVLVRVLLCILMFVPLLNIITLLVLSSRATRRLRDAGYQVGLLGAKR